MRRRQAGPLLEDAAERGRVSMRARWERVRIVWRSLVQVAIAAPAAWLVATHVLGHPRPFFAPVAAIIVLGQSFAQRGRRALEVAIGVAVGIAIADVLVAGIGVGAWQITIVVVLAIVTARFLGNGQLLANQAAVSAVLVATIQTTGGTFGRFFDGLVGGAIALLVNAVVVPAHPVRIVRDAAQPLLDELAETLEDVARTILARDRDAAEAVLRRARAIDGLEAQLDDAIATGRETTRYAPSRRRSRATVESYASAAGQIDLAVRNVRVLARGLIRAVDLDERVPPDVADAVRDLAAAVRALGPVLGGDAPARELREPALRAAGRASAVLERTGNLSVSVIVGQVRSTAVDLLAGSGLGYEAAAAAVRRAAREAEADAAAGTGSGASSG
jgi:uncharacterized membrane protein YgaE (UPF0421/DUF939 family)